MKKIFVIALLLPFTTYAAWWNPLTWFSDPTYETASVVQIETETPVKEPTPVEPEIVEVVKEVEVEKPVIKEVIKTETITVQDPALQARINQLVAENVSLREQIASLKLEITSLKNQSSTIPVVGQVDIDENQAEIDRKKKEMEAQIWELASILTELESGKYIYNNDAPNTSSLVECIDYTLPDILIPYRINTDSMRHTVMQNYGQTTYDFDCISHNSKSDAKTAITVEQNRLRAEISRL